MIKKLLATLSILGLMTTSAFSWDVTRMNTQINETNFLIEDWCSGTLIDNQKNLILTAAHCLVKREVGKEMTVHQNYFNPEYGTEVHKSYKVKIIKVDLSRDAALLQVEDPDAHWTVAAKISYKPVHRGEEVYIVGNPTGPHGEATLTKGIVSNAYRPSEYEGEVATYIQVDAGVAGGNSGGALYNADGEYIGLVDAMMSQVSYCLPNVQGMPCVTPVNHLGLAVSNLSIQEFLDGVN